MGTLLQPGREPVEGARCDASGAWIPVANLSAATGWELKPEGACLGDLCVPLPRGREPEFADGGAFNAVALAHHLDQPAAFHEPSATWALGESAVNRGAALQSLEAPDFTLPDLEGRLHSLSDYRGRKVFLASWASW